METAYIINLPTYSCVVLYVLYVLKCAVCDGSSWIKVERLFLLALNRSFRGRRCCERLA